MARMPIEIVLIGDREELAVSEAMNRANAKRGRLLETFNSWRAALQDARVWPR